YRLLNTGLVIQMLDVLKLPDLPELMAVRAESCSYGNLDRSSRSAWIDFFSWVFAYVNSQLRKRIT
ncbi:hypothetical protein D917_08102, partial [Trichinella nativa]